LAVDADAGRVELDVKGENQMGFHVTGSVVVTLAGTLQK
jgi:hypothetical protein